MFWKSSHMSSVALACSQAHSQAHSQACLNFTILYKASGLLKGLNGNAGAVQQGSCNQKGTDFMDSLSHSTFD